MAECPATLAALREQQLPIGDTEEILIYKMAHFFVVQHRAGTVIAKHLVETEVCDRKARELSLLIRSGTRCGNLAYLGRS
jgi:hypothetical protein